MKLNMSLLAINYLISNMFHPLNEKKTDSVYPRDPYWEI